MGPFWENLKEGKGACSINVDLGYKKVTMARDHKDGKKKVGQGPST